MAVSAGDTSATASAGGALMISGGGSTGAGGAGGAIELVGGASTSAAGGDVSVRSGCSDGGASGAVSVGSSDVTAGQSGDVSVHSGASSGSASGALTLQTGAAGDITVGAAAGATGASTVVFEFIDDDPTANFIITEHTLTTASAVGASETTTKYNTWLYDSTDFFTLDSTDDDIATTVQAASEAQFEAANALHNDLATHMTMTYRKTATVSTGVSLITVGT